MFDMSQGQLVSQFLLHKNNGEDYTPWEMESTLVERSEENKLEDIVQDGEYRTFCHNGYFDKSNTQCKNVDVYDLKEVHMI